MSVGSDGMVHVDRTTVQQGQTDDVRAGLPGGPTSLRLDPDQQAVVDNEAGPLLVLGAAGTGKTTVVAEAAVSRVRDRGLDPGRVLVLTFSRAATRALAERIAARLGETARTVPVLSIHGFCHAVHAAAHRTDPWRVLTAPEQELRLREILRGSSSGWGALNEAIGTRAFARELRDLVARARQRGLDPVDLERFGREDGRPEWIRAAGLFEEYLDVLDAERVVDYDELVHRVRILFADPATGDPLRARFDAVLVDDLQDAVPAHAALLHQIAPPGGRTELLATANPDHAAFAFRGVDPTTVWSFPAGFGAPGGLAPVRVLRTDHRHGPVLADCLQAQTRLMAHPPALPPWRGPVPTGRAQDPVRPGLQDAAVFIACADPREESAAVTQALVSAHDEAGVPWHRMAVVVRSRGPAEAVLRRRLQRAGVPIAFADDTPLADEPAVRVLLEVVLAALGPATVPEETRRRLVLGPLGAVDPLELRRHQRLQAGGGDGLSRVEAGLDQVDRAVELTREAILAGGGAEEVLWAAWSATDWPERLRSRALESGPEADRADRDLDAVVALFDFAGRASSRRGRVAAEELVEEVGHQQIAADSSMTRRLGRDAVAVVTALRCGGHEWDLVVVAGVQEGTWPGRRRRPGLLVVDQLGADGSTPPVTQGEALAEERRLFHQACARARQRLVVTAVDDPDGGEGRPSRFISESRLTPTRFDRGAVSVPTAAALVGELREVGSDPAVGPDVRERAALALARLGEEIPSARPRNWWSVRARTSGDRPLVALHEPVRLSGSSVDDLRSCPRRWFLERRAGGALAASEPSTVGNLVHRLAQLAVTEQLDPAGLREAFDAAWPDVPSGPAWRTEARRERVWSMVAAWWDWQAERPAAHVVGVEVPFRCELDVSRSDGRPERVLLTGVVDRLEIVDDQLVVVDYKTGRPRTAKEVQLMGQLGVYQAAARAGAFDEVTGGRTRRPGKALAVYLDAGQGTPAAKTLVQPSILEVPAPEGTDPGLAPDWITAALGEAAAIVRDEEFTARRGNLCRGCRFAVDCTADGGIR